MDYEKWHDFYNSGKIEDYLSYLELNTNDENIFISNEIDLTDEYF